jgi:zinc protease
MKINCILAGSLIMGMSLSLSAGGARAGLVRKVLLPSPGSSLVALRILVETGAAYDPAGKEGLASLTATTMAEGGTPELTYSQVIEAIYPTAAEIRVGVDKEVIVFSGTVHRDKLAEFYGIMRDVVLTPRFDPLDFERERENHINYLTKVLAGNDDESLGKELLGLSLYEGHPYGHVNQGTVRGLQGITIDDLKTFHRTYFTRDRIVVGVAGGYPEELLSWLDRDFGSLPEGAGERIEIEAPQPFEEIQVLLCEKPCRATAISIGFPLAVDRGDDDFYPLLVANSYLGEHRTFNGLLMKKIRGERGLNYGDYSYIEHFVQDGGSTFALPNMTRSTQYASVWIRPVAHEHAHFALRAALRELDRLARGDVDGEALLGTRSFLANYSKLWTQTLTRRLGYKMDSEFYSLDDYIAEIGRRVPGLTLDEVIGASKKYLGTGGIKIAIVTEDAGSLRERLLADTPSPITYEGKTLPPGVLEEDGEIETYSIRLTPDNVRIVKAEELFLE